LPSGTSAFPGKKALTHSRPVGITSSAQSRWLWPGAWGIAHRSLDNVTAIGIDEICWKKKGSKFLTLAYQIDDGCKRLLWIGKDRTKKTLLNFFGEFGPERSSKLRFICTDMWKPYLQVVAEKAGRALNVLDRFHIMSHMNKAIDKVRATEAKTLKVRGKEPILTGSRWCLLKRPENRTEKQTAKLNELLAINLKTVRAYLLKEDFQQFWTSRARVGQPDSLTTGASEPCARG